MCDIYDWIQSIGIIATLAIAIWQMRIHENSTQASTEISLIAELDEANFEFHNEPRLWNLLEQPYNSIQCRGNREKVDTPVYIIFNTLELAFRHYSQYVLIQTDEWRECEKSIRKFFKLPFICGWWLSRRGEFTDQIVKCVDATVLDLIKASTQS